MTTSAFARGSDRARRVRPIGHTLFAIAAILMLVGCGSSTTGDRRSPFEVPSSVEALDAEPRVDLPGRVSVFLRVSNVDGSPSSNLTGADFNIYENGVLVSQTESFQRILAQPQVFRSYLHLVLDRSNSVQSVGAAAVQAGARSLIEIVTEEPENYVKISWFDGSPTIYPIAGYDFGFSNDRTLLLEAIDALNDEPPFSTSTNLYGAVVDGIAALDAEDVAAAQSGVENRALTLVTFTDGTHQAGPAVTLGDALTAIDTPSPEGTAHSSFTIGVGSEFDANVLFQLGRTGTASADEFDELEDAFRDIGDQVRRLANSFYFLSYCSPKTSGVNNLRVSVLEEPDDSRDARFTFDAQGFGGGCAFLDIKNHPSLAGGSARAFVSDAVELDDGRVIAVGWWSDDCLQPGCGSTSRAFVARFRASAADVTGSNLPDGQLDSTFGDGGILELEASNFAVSGATSVAIDDAGALLVGGWARANAQSGFSQAAVWSLGADGSSVVRTDLGNPGGTDQAVLDVAAVASGGCVAAGFRGIGSRSFAVWRLLDDLSPDLGFGVDGLVLAPESPTVGNEGATGVVVDGGRIYSVGHVSGGIRILGLDLVDGSLDSSFGTSGVVDALRTFDGETYGARAGEVMLDSLGRLVIGGTLSGTFGGGPTRQQPAVWRILSTGAPDESFAGSLSAPTFGTGVVTLREGSTNNPSIDFGRDSRVESIAAGPDGTILVAGERENAAGHTDLAIFAFTPTGVPQSAYNLLGFVIDDGASADDSFEGASVLRVLDSGAIWALGISNPLDPDAPGGTADVPTVWVDRDPARAFAPIGQ
ncbi:MAG: hypothetical protein AAF726_22175 [Planctomycetota bacterium]